MYKKLFAPVILALVAALAFSNLALAANNSSKIIYHENGTILNVDAAAMIIQVDTPLGKYKIHLDANTVYRGKADSFAELTPWMVVNVRAKLLHNGEYLALSVNVLRTEQVYQAGGQVTALRGMTFTILGTDGNAYTFLVKAKTSFSGTGVKKFIQLRPGMQVNVSYIVMANGKLRAQKVLVLNTN